MGILSNTALLTHQALLGSGYASLVQVNNYVQSGFNLVVASADAQIELDMLLPYLKNLNTVYPTTSANLLRVATSALELHITNRSGQTFNDYLFTHGLKVSTDFASLSAAIGTKISPNNIA